MFLYSFKMYQQSVAFVERMMDVKVKPRLDSISENKSYHGVVRVTTRKMVLTRRTVAVGRRRAETAG